MRSLLSLAVLATVTTGCATEAPHALDAHLALDADASHEISAAVPVRDQAAAVDAVREAPVTDGLINPNVAIDSPEPVLALLDCGNGAVEVAIDEDSASAVDESPAEALVDLIEGAWVPVAEASLLEVVADPYRHLDADGPDLAVDADAGAAPWMAEQARSEAAVDPHADLVGTLGELREESCRAIHGCGGMEQAVDADPEHDLLLSVSDAAIYGEYEACRLVVARD